MLARGPPCTAIMKSHRPLLRNFADGHPEATPLPCCISHDRYLTLLQTASSPDLHDLCVAHCRLHPRLFVLSAPHVAYAPDTDPLEEIPDPSTVCNTVVRPLHIVIDRRDGARGANFAVARPSRYTCVSVMSPPSETDV